MNAGDVSLRSYLFPERRVSALNGSSGIWNMETTHLWPLVVLASPVKHSTNGIINLTGTISTVSTFSKIRRELQRTDEKQHSHLNRFSILSPCGKSVSATARKSSQRYTPTIMAVTCPHGTSSGSLRHTNSTIIPIKTVKYSANERKQEKRTLRLTSWNAHPFGKRKQDSLCVWIRFRYACTD